MQLLGELLIFKIMYTFKNNFLLRSLNKKYVNFKKKKKKKKSYQTLNKNTPHQNEARKILILADILTNLNKYFATLA